MLYKVLSLHHGEQNALFFSGLRVGLLQLILYAFFIGQVPAQSNSNSLNKFEKFHSSIIKKKNNHSHRVRRIMLESQYYSLLNGQTQTKTKEFVNLCFLGWWEIHLTGRQLVSSAYSLNETLGTQKFKSLMKMSNSSGRNSELEP